MDEVEPKLFFDPVEIPQNRLLEFQEFFEELNKETDRGAALSTTAFIDDLLGQILTAFLIPNKSARELINEPNSPLGTFATRIQACHAMGLISDLELRECNLLRKIRNEFAHKVKMSFDDARVKGFCSGLTTLGEWPDGEPVVARLRFHLSAVAIIMNLTNRPSQAEQRALNIVRGSVSFISRCFGGRPRQHLRSAQAFVVANDDGVPSVSLCLGLKC